MTEHSQETKVAILEANVEHMVGHVKELTHRVRGVEKVCGIVSAGGIACGGIVGTTVFNAPKAEAFEIESQQPYDGMLPDNSMNINNWMNKMRQWELEQSMKDPEFDINNALAEFFNGSDDTAEAEEVLQFPSN